MAYESDMINLKDTELRLGLPGSNEPAEKQSSMSKKRALPAEESSSGDENNNNQPPAK